MTLLLEYTAEEDIKYEQFPPLGVAYTKQDPTYEQAKYFIEIVKPKLEWQDVLGDMAVYSANITLGEE